MLSLDRINEYVNVVCHQIRWKKAHFRISEEMQNHIIDGRDSYIAQGLDESTATEKALADTGDATEIGTQLDRIHRPKPQWGMFVATAILLILGLLVRLFVFRDEDRIGLISIRLIYTGIGVAGMIAAYFTDFTIIGKYPKTIYFGVISISLAMLLFSPTLNGRSYYAQYIILLFPLAFSAIIFATRNKGYLGILLCGLAFALPGFISLYVPSVSGFLLFAIVGATVLGIAICKNWFNTKRVYSFLLMLAPVALLAIVFFINMTPYRWNRLAVAFNPFIDPNGVGYMGVMVRKLLSGATFFGRGNIPSEYLVGLTEPHQIFYTDLLLTALISLLGWITFASILSGLLFFIAKGFILCFRQKSSLGLFVSTAIMMTFCMQVISYIAFNLGFQFASPISLPLISYGNTATIINLVLIGFMLSVFRTGDVVADGKIPTITKLNRFISWNDGKLTINFKY
jgi:cell division protein FtsW (lipid II flippase)